MSTAECTCGTGHYPCKVRAVSGSLLKMPVHSTPNYFPTIEEFKAFIANRSRLITLDDIAKACDVSVSWIKQVLSGEIQNPSYKNITAVYKYIAEIENSK